MCDALGRMSGRFGCHYHPAALTTHTLLVKGPVMADAHSTRRLPVGTVSIRTRHNRGKVRRAYVKVAEPSVWILRARLVWERAHGPIPRGVGIHHKDRDTLNDALDNLELVSKAEHLAIHRPEFQDKATANFVRARRERRWSTRSATKQTGRPVKFDLGKMAQAVTAFLAGEGPYRAVAERYGVPWHALAHQIRKLGRDHE
jgi:hypothetical protein